MIPNAVSHSSCNYSGYFHLVSICISHLHHHASIMYLEETALWIPRAADYCTQRPADSSAQSSWTAKLAGRNEDKQHRLLLKPHILLHQPIRLTLTWQHRGASLTLGWITSPEICGCPQHPEPFRRSLFSSPGVKVSRLYCSTAVNQQSDLAVGEKVSYKVLAQGI